MCGMKEGDFIVGINEVDAKWSPHDEVVGLIKASGHDLRLRVVTPMPAPEVEQRAKQKVRGRNSLDGGIGIE